MKGRILAALLVYIYIYTITAPAICWALHDSTSFSPEKVRVEASNTAVPVGTVLVWTREEIPEGWLECNGQPVNKTLYPDLYKLMTKTPNYQGMFLRGAGSQIINHGSYGSVTHGTKLGEVQGDTIRKLTAHWYSNWENSAGGAYWDNTSGIVSSTITNDYSGESMQLGGGGIHKMILDSSTDVPSSKENRPVNVGVKYIIKAE